MSHLIYNENSGLRGNLFDYYSGILFSYYLQLAQLYPSCTVVADYRKSKSLEADAENGLPHFLWASNRLAIARDIESRLVSIYTKLVMLEKYILSSKSLKDMIFDSVMNGIDHSKRKSIGIEALNRWKESANNALSGRKEEESQI